MGCCDGNSWKREEKKDHRFDFIEISDFHTNSFGCRMAHMFVWFATIRSFAILGLDIYTAVGLLLLKTYNSAITQQNFIAHDITKWIFAGCIILSVVLLIWDWIVALRIMKSKNISFAFTNLIANRVYSLRSYDHHCLFYKLESSSHRSNKMAFWVFFSFIGWKRLLLSEGPRQAINALTVFSVLSTRNFSFQPSAYANITPFQWTVLGFMSLSLVIWLFSFARFCFASLLFFPLLCHIQGGLTEFVVRKIDKRIERIIEKARKKRLERYARARAADRSSDRTSKNSSNKSLIRTKSLIKESPTLPSIPMIDEKNIGYARGYDTDSLYSHSSLAKSDFDAPIVRSETLPMYRQHYDSQQPTIPILQSPPRLTQPPRSLSQSPTRSPPRLMNDGYARRGPRPPMRQQVPSYHRMESYSRPPPPPRQPSGPRMMPRSVSNQSVPMRQQHGGLDSMVPMARRHNTRPGVAPMRFGDESPFPTIPQSRSLEF